MNKSAAQKIYGLFVVKILPNIEILASMPQASRGSVFEETERG